MKEIVNQLENEINNSVHDNGKGKFEFLLAMLANAIYFYNNCIGRAMLMYHSL